MRDPLEILMGILGDVGRMNEQELQVFERTTGMDEPEMKQVRLAIDIRRHELKTK